MDYEHILLHSDEEMDVSTLITPSEIQEMTRDTIRMKECIEDITQVLNNTSCTGEHGDKLSPFYLLYTVRTLMRRFVKQNTDIMRKYNIHVHVKEHYE